LVRVQHVHLQDRLTRHIDFKKYDAKSKKYKSINCPPDVAMALLQRSGLWNHIPVIDGITTAPTLRADGSILDQPGYDAATRVLYIKPQGVTYPEIPREPTWADARAALDRIGELVSEFPFIAENGDNATGKKSPSRSVAYSGFITPMVRRALAASPLHAFDATAAGSGKSKLVSIASVFARGHEAPVTSGAAINPEEFEKKIAAALIAGDSIVAIDNLEAPLGGELLCSATTEAMLSIRVLGLSKNVLVPNSAVFFATGNAMTVIGDMVRRSLCPARSSGGATGAAHHHRHGPGDAGEAGPRPLRGRRAHGAARLYRRRPTETIRRTCGARLFRGMVGPGSRRLNLARRARPLPDDGANPEARPEAQRARRGAASMARRDGR
jgi:putative DNA primase/helicase